MSEPDQSYGGSSDEWQPPAELTQYGMVAPTTAEQSLPQRRLPRQISYPPPPPPLPPAHPYQPWLLGGAAALVVLLVGLLLLAGAVALL